MALKTISKSIEIYAPAEAVWHVLFDDETYRQWCAEFSPGSYAVTDWKTGSEAQFLDTSKAGLLATISESIPPHQMTISYVGTVENGIPDFDNEEAQAMKNAKEIYRLNEADGMTRLEIASDMDEKYFNDMSEAWDRALAKVKQLAESK